MEAKAALLLNFLESMFLLVAMWFSCTTEQCLSLVCTQVKINLLYLHHLTIKVTNRRHLVEPTCNMMKYQDTDGDEVCLLGG